MHNTCIHADIHVQHVSSSVPCPDTVSVGSQALCISPGPFSHQSCPVLPQSGSAPHLHKRTEPKMMCRSAGREKQSK